MLCHAILYQWYNLIKAGKGLFSGIFPKDQGSDFLGERNDSIVKSCVMNMRMHLIVDESGMQS